MKQHFKIGEISKLYGIGTDSLRYYESMGILMPRRGENGYRIYSLQDLWRLNVIRDLRKLGFSMERIKEYLESRSVAATETLLNEELTAVNEELGSLERLKEEVEERLAVIHEVKNRELGKIEQRYMKERKCYIIHSGYNSDEEMDMLIKQLLNKDTKNLYIIGNNRIGSMISQKCIEEEQYQDYESVFIIDRNGNDILEAGEYLTVCYQGDGDKNYKYIPALVQYAHEHGLAPVGPIQELIWIDIHQSADFKEHIAELQMRCRIKE